MKPTPFAGHTGFMNDLGSSSMEEKESSGFGVTTGPPNYSAEDIMERLISSNERALITKAMDKVLTYYESPGSYLLSALQAYEVNDNFKSFLPLVQHIIVKYFGSKEETFSLRGVSDA